MSQKYVIVHFIDKVKVSDEFPASEWPLHITLLANFTLAKPLNDLKVALRNYSQQSKPYSVVADGEALFGPNQNVAVSLLQTNESLKNMHARLWDIASNLGAVFDEPKFMGEGFRPHATIQTSSRLIDKQTVDLSDITLVDMFPDENISRRRIIETYSLASE